MEYIVIAFRSRAHTVKFYDMLQSNGLYCEIINTPKQVGVGCGLSVKINTGGLIPVKKMLKKTSLSSFAGLFLVKETGKERIIRNIN